MIKAAFSTGANFLYVRRKGNMVATLTKSGTGCSIGGPRAYDAWGNILSGAGSGDPKGRYCANLGHKQDDESGLTYMRARYYEATSGRFVSEDESKSGANFYVYCSSVPTCKSDQSGAVDMMDWLVTVFRGPDWLLKEMMQAYESGGIDGFIEYIDENWAMERIAFSVGAPAIVGPGVCLRIWMAYSQINYWLDDGTLAIDQEAELQFLSSDALDLGRLVAAGETSEVSEI